MSDKTKHLLVCAITSAFASAGIALLLWVSLALTSCEELMEHLLAPVWFSGVACALAMGVGKEYGDECAECNGNKNKNGNALAKIVSLWAEQGKLK